MAVIKILVDMQLTKSKKLNFKKSVPLKTETEI